MGYLAPNSVLQMPAITIQLPIQLYPQNFLEQYGVTSLARDPYGMVYSGDILGNVYKYNGSTGSSWTAISGLPSVGQSRCCPDHR